MLLVIYDPWINTKTERLEARFNSQHFSFLRVVEISCSFELSMKKFI